MNSYTAPNQCLSICNTIDPCNKNNCNDTTNNQLRKNSGYYRAATCYRPLQQIYKTVYSPTCGNNLSRINFACICRPSERYKTTNMTYGSFHYNNWAYRQKTQPIHYDREFFIQCYDKNMQKQNLYSTKNCNNRFALTYDTNESQNWTQPTGDCCCPTDCCNETKSSGFQC